MKGHLLKRSICILILLLSAVIFPATSQSFKNGIRQGMVKVKFSPAVAGTVSRIHVDGRRTGLSTGITAFDEKARIAKASNMYRLFPYDPKNEDKLRKHGLHLWYVVEIDESTDPRTAVFQFAQLNEIEHAEVEREKIISPYKVEAYQSTLSALAALPFNDPLLKDQWHYDNIGQTGFGDADINLFKAWETTTGSSNIIVSVHDEGVDVNHEDLKGNIWVNTDEIANNEIDDDANGYIDDVNGFNFAKNKGAVDAQFHGTHVAGTIAAVNNNGKGVCGVAGGSGSGNGVKVMSLQILGGGLIERSFIYAANNGAVISQNSWGYSTEGYYDESVRDAIHYFIAEAGNYEGSPLRGGIVIFAAGNSNADGLWYPGRDESILSVSSIGPEWKKAEYSNYGAWVEIAAPGGDQINYTGKNGVLSTIPGNKYAYIQGTSMACPHVSGVAALVLANREKQLTPDELWQKLLTGVVPIDEQNPDFIGKLGSGAIDAFLAIRNDQKKSPNAITDLAIKGVAQEFAKLEWTVPNDDDDEFPSSFTIYFHTQPLSQSNLYAAAKIDLINNSSAGTIFNKEISPLLGFTTYYFAITSTDRWGNISLLSNISSASTNEGPSIAISPESIEIDLDAGISITTSSPLTITNNGAGILRWSHVTRHRSSELAFSTSGLRYPGHQGVTKATPIVGKTSTSRTPIFKSTEAASSNFTEVEKSLSSWPTNIVGETDLTLSNSAAARFYVSEEGGFNLTNVSMYLKHDPAKGPVIVEIFEGSAPTKSNLVYAQEYVSWTSDEISAFIQLDEQIYFEKGATFWVAFHIPAGNLFPLGIGYELESASSSHCFISFNVGATWQSLEEALNDKNFAWSMTTASYNPFLGTYLTLDPARGDVNSEEQVTANVQADGSTLINGTYLANVIIGTNDAVNPEVRVPVELRVAGHQPDIRHTDIADFGAGFIGEKKIFQLELDNQGFGNLTNPLFEISGPDFAIEGSTPYSISALEKVLIPITFNPTSAGNKNATLTISNETFTYSIALTGVGAETSKIAISPETQVFNNLAIGEEVTAQIVVENTGTYPLKFFIPGHDTRGVSEDWPTAYHSYGYALRSNKETEANPIPFTFQDISSTGVDITASLIKDDVYFELDMGFSFPYYGEAMKKIYIAQKGFTTFDNSVKPLNTPTLNNPSNPGGYISLLGTFLTYIAEGKIFYQREPDKLIVQYHNVTDGSAGHITAQMVLHVNGDIRFYYENIGYSETAQSYLNILIEDIQKQDGILVHDYLKPVEIFNGLAIGFDYPGPAIINSVTNGSGIIAPGASVNVEIQLNTTSLAEGQTKRYINFISNDPANKEANALIELNVTSGGIANPILSHTAIDFGHVFQGAVRSQSVTIKNEGTANAEINSISLDNNSFVVNGDVPATIKPGLFSTYDITIPTDVIVSLSDQLTIHYTDGYSQQITLSGNVVDPPAIVVDLSPLEETLDYGDSVSHPFTIQNPGIANLDFSIVGTQWMSFNTDSQPSTESYAIEKHNTGGIYQWLDIRKTGVQMPFADDTEDPAQYWRDLTLPFPFKYFGNTYTELKVGENGIISFEEDPEVMMFSDSIPSSIYPGAYIMPYWMSGGFNTMFFAKEDVGIFYQFDEDKLIITWSHLVNTFGGMGDAMSAQVILYQNGMIKFQYKIEENGSDQTSTSTLIGLQSSITEGIFISDNLALDHGKGLAYNIIPANKFTIEPGQTMSGEILLTAKHNVGGSYDASLKLYSNVPGREFLEKPVHLNINGEGTLTTPAEVDFGNKIIVFDAGLPVASTEEIDITNTGTAPVDVTWIESLSGGSQWLGLQVYLLVDGWIGPSWEWVDVSQVYSPWYSPSPIFSLMPGDKLKARAVFYPGEVGDFEDEIVFTTTSGEVRMPVRGSGVEPPVITMETESISVDMKKMDEVIFENIVFNNNDGRSNLEYSVTVDFDRADRASTSEQTSASSPETSSLNQVSANVRSGIQTNGAYNRELKYTDKSVPKNHVGTGGSAPFPVATRFNAGSEGFLLSHIETWFRAETQSSGTLEIEVRAGGTSISDAARLWKETVSFNRSGNDQDGNWEQIALKEPVRIYPGEDFYVIVTYPLGIEFPQGIVTEEALPSTYFYYENGVWFDLQLDEGFTKAAWLMHAAEIEAGPTSWLTITSPLKGDLAPGEQASLALSIEGAYAQRGDQRAYVIISSNDPQSSEIRVPVNLHINEAPRFMNAPELITVAENDTIIVNINVLDVEGDSVGINAISSAPHLSSTFNDGVFTLMLAPDFGTAGNYEYIFKAVDEWSEASEIRLPVEILHTNQAPKYIGTTDIFELSPANELSEYQLSAYFVDPDNDQITFTLVSQDTDIVEAFISSDKFLLKPKGAGETSLIFTVTDVHGASLIETRSVTVNVILSAESPSRNNGLRLFPNPTENWLSIQFDDKCLGQASLRIMDITGRPIIEEKVEAAEDGGFTIDVSEIHPGTYMLEASCSQKRSVVKFIKK